LDILECPKIVETWSFREFIKCTPSAFAIFDYKIRYIAVNLRRLDNEDQTIC